jgi:hypothetical protein
MEEYQGKVGWIFFKSKISLKEHKNGTTHVHTVYTAGTPELQAKRTMIKHVRQRIKIE